MVEPTMGCCKKAAGLVKANWLTSCCCCQMAAERATASGLNSCCEKAAEFATASWLNGSSCCCD